MLYQANGNATLMPRLLFYHNYENLTIFFDKIFELFHIKNTSSESRRQKAALRRSHIPRLSNIGALDVDRHCPHGQRHLPQNRRVILIICKRAESRNTWVSCKLSFSGCLHEVFVLYSNLHGGIAQLGERLNGIQEVMGSSPTVSRTKPPHQ